jgi:poly [ADP-ribose] polymerase
VRKAVLQVTDIKTNRNKYYAIELHSTEEKGKAYFRVYTHYGRTDDLETNPDSGQKECRYFETLPEAEGNYQSIYAQKTSARKGYKEISLASSKIGSQQARGTSSGEVDAKTIEKIEKAQKGEVKKPASLNLPPEIKDLVAYLFSEATSALTSTVAAKITANGIETPLGVLTIGQIEKGEAILTELYQAITGNSGSKRARLEDLSGQFYTLIPHRIGRSRDAVAAAVIDSVAQFGEKQDTLQLMKDMLQVNGAEGNVLYAAQIDEQYKSLNAEISPVEKSMPEYRDLESYVLKSQVKSKNIKIANIFKLRRPHEAMEFAEQIGNQRLLFHGSRIQNWVGLLSRGILLPKVVVNLGVNRTDAGWLGNGIYFGDAACTSAFYTTPGRKHTRFMAIANVALGKMKDFNKITYGITEPPPGYHSCHGVRRTWRTSSQFDDDEYVIYDGKQKRMDYLVEFTA